MTRQWISLGVAVVMSVCTAASARPPVVRLSYRTDAGIPDCPDAAELKRSVEARLGRAPWDPDAERQVEVRVSRAGVERRASIEIRDRGGALLGQRALRSRRADCRELAEAMALALALAIDPLRLNPGLRPSSRRAPPTRPSQAASRSVPLAVDAAPRAVPHRPGTRSRLIVGVGGAISLGTAPCPAGSVTARVGVRRRWLSASAEARVDLPAFAQVAGGRISTSLAGSSLIACGHHRWLQGCGLVTVAALTATGHELLEARSSTRLYAGAGVRAGLEIPLRRWLALQLRADLLVPFTRIHLVDSRNGARFWSSWPASGAFGLNLVGSFL